MDMDKLNDSHLAGLMESGGAVVLVDGQFGSTGKGLLASALAALHHRPMVTSNAGPNSGHTFYHNGEKHVLTQLPTYGVKQHLLGKECHIHMNSGAVIDAAKLVEEIQKYEGINVSLSPYASIADPSGELDLTLGIGSTGKGTGAGIANKVMRKSYGIVESIQKITQITDVPLTKTNKVYDCDPLTQKIFVEVSQGYSLGIDAGFYPYCTSRNCTVGQALSDAALHPDYYAGSIMTVRTYPIRVGGNSGPGYEDQQEISWNDIGVEPELTTVTGKQRRLFTWSDIQYRESLEANRPQVVFLNFANYLENESEIREFVWENVFIPYIEVMGAHPEAILIGVGPRDDDVYVWDNVPF